MKAVLTNLVSRLPSIILEATYHLILMLLFRRSKVITQNPWLVLRSPRLVADILEQLLQKEPWYRLPSESVNGR